MPNAILKFSGSVFGLNGYEICYQLIVLTLAQAVEGQKVDKSGDNRYQANLEAEFVE